jgi:demethylmenaquinone methyltransferase/2-methoxy-6-polyprenyl-1,4-benzoquinol methylase
VSDINTAVVDSLKVLDPNRPIREADIGSYQLNLVGPNYRFPPTTLFSTFTKYKTGAKTRPCYRSRLLPYKHKLCIKIWCTALTEAVVGLNTGANSVTYAWVNIEKSAVSHRYDRLAGLIPFFEWLFFLPRGLRKKAVDRLTLRLGDRVLEVGCGTGRNFPYLYEAVGRSGQIYGVDLSSGMLHRAKKLRDRHGWDNIHLTQGDAADFHVPEQLDGAFFSLSYNTMPHHLKVMRQAWKQLRPGGRLVVMDAKLPPGLGGRLILPFSLWLMKRTMLGNPFIQPWEDLQQFDGEFDMQEFMFGSYYICHAVKP